MKLFEFEAKAILTRYGIPVPQSKLATSPEEVQLITREIGGPVALKSQVLVSGRGKAGGILFADSPEQARKVASSLLGSRIKGSVVSRLLVERKLDIVEQLYTAIAVDREMRTYAVLASTSGGVDIEEVARSAPDKISRHLVDPYSGFTDKNATDIVSRLNLKPADAVRLASILNTLYRVVMDYDAELVEINPLAKTRGGELVAADARIIIDDNALFRHPEFKERSSDSAEDTPLEMEAKKKKLAYVDLDGDIGIVGNGAGLVMATLDMVHLLGGKPANFLDVGGGARSDVIKEAVMLVMSKPQVRAVLLNILGGITRCDLVAKGVIDGLDQSPVKKPVAVRMMGTNEAEGTQILNQAGINIYPNMEEAAKEVIKLAGL